jgi:hypothetical protein
MGLLRSDGQKINRRRLIVPSSLHRTYGAHHLHFITCFCYRRDCSYRFYFMDEAGPVRINEGWGEISFSSSCRVIQTLLQRFMVPALRKPREERGTPLC